MRTLTLAVLVIMVIALVGCTQQPPLQNESNQTVAPPPVVKNPVIAISSPTSDQTFTISTESTNINLVLTTQNLVIKQPGGTAKKGEGYFRVTLDNDRTFTVTSKSYYIPDVPLGSHTLRVELLNNDGSPYSPAISREVNFIIEAEQPTEYVPQNYVIRIVDSGFDPMVVTIKSGDSVTFVNTLAMPQSAVSFIGSREIFNTKTLSQNQNATVTIHEEGEFSYYSYVKPLVKGTITVQSNGTQ